jgi:heptaprenylglyceryl phosphate synthase
MEWVYSEAGHGKGAPDGVGAAAKRMADEYVAHGGAITCSSDLVKLIQGGGIPFVEEVSE